MAVASYQAEGCQVMRAFDAPKRSSLRAWYTAATAMIPDAPRFEPHFEQVADITTETIIFKGADWTLFIARKRTLK